MATTTYYGILLPGEADQDWMTILNRALAALSEVARSNQKPAGVDLRWGDLTGLKYLRCGADGVQVLGGMNFSLGQAKNFVVEGGAEFPTETTDGQLFYRSDTDVLYLRANGAWTVMGAVTSDTIEAAGGLVIGSLGTGKGSFAVSDGTGGLEVVNPSVVPDQSVPTANSAAANGWTFLAPDAFLALQYTAKGDLLVGSAAQTLGVLEAVDGKILQADDAEPLGIAWVSLMSAWDNEAWTEQGQIRASTGAGTATRIDPPTADGQVLLADAAEFGGMRWADQAELGIVESIIHRNAVDQLAGIIGLI